MSESAMVAACSRRRGSAIEPFGEDCSATRAADRPVEWPCEYLCFEIGLATLARNSWRLAAGAALGGRMKRWMLGCVVLCAAACKTTPPVIPGSNPGNPQGECRQTPVTGT